ncbi:18505_t:CDS:2 [Rhizophagus irregularis]|nr:18505_t:CDS:2 [Rhizophagus irregularis]
MSKEVNSSNDQDTAENEIVNNQDININTIVSKLEVSNLEESNTTLTSSSWDDGNTTVRKLEESNTKVIISGRITSIINWEESDITGLERCNINKLIDAFLGYRWESEKRHKWEKYELEKRQIIEIIRHLAYNNSYRVHGYWICHQWQCGHRPQQCLSVRQCENKHKYVYYWNECNHNQKCPNRTECRKKYNLRQWQRENFCQREWQKQYDQKLLKQYLEAIPKRFEWLGLFIRICDKHRDDGGNLISSFLLYNSENSNENPDMEIIRHLVWNDKYRVFGNWGCSSCRKRWRSAYTWISLQKYIEKTPGKRLNRFNDDYIIQKCKKEECGDDGIILGYEHLVLSEDGVEHKRHLCAKCLNNETCLESGTYYGKQK